VSRASDLGGDLDAWLAPFLGVMGRSTRSKWAPLYVRGLLGPDGPKSVQPLAARLGLPGHDPLHHFVSSPAWDDGPLWRVLAEQARMNCTCCGSAAVTERPEVRTAVQRAQRRGAEQDVPAERHPRLHGVLPPALPANLVWDRLLGLHLFSVPNSSTTTKLSRLSPILPRSARCSRAAIAMAFCGLIQPGD
jgi:DDE superfamily endonuclease